MPAIERARPDDRPGIEALLRASDLPLDGLDVALGMAVLARREGTVVGCAAVEPYGRFGLLRSVCVAVELRGTGLGHALVAAAESALCWRRGSQLRDHHGKQYGIQCGERISS